MYCVVGDVLVYNPTETMCSWPIEGPWPGASQSGRNYSMHFVKFSGLKPATSYSYKVKSGAAGAVWCVSPSVSLSVS